MVSAPVNGRRAQRRSHGLSLAVACLLAGAGSARPAEEPPLEARLAEPLRRLDTTAIPAELAAKAPPRRMLARHARARLRQANDRESAAWHAVRTREEWQGYRDARIARLRESLGTFPQPAAAPRSRATSSLDFDDVRIDNILFESRPGLVVSANLYRPAGRGGQTGPPAKSRPGILICHSHHNPKSQAELVELGVHWARAGCLVLVMDQLGHGERRIHPFRSRADYDGEFRPGRQDYYFRHNAEMLLMTMGDSLMGWMTWDLSRGVDLLLAQDDVDPGKIVLLGAVAGGGDPAAVAAALDGRVACVVPFNFGGPQPETVYPLPEDAEASFNYSGSGGWESTRNLRNSARDGFLPWVIVGAAAPRALIYAHEFAWDRERDPVWNRLERIWGFYGRADLLGHVQGRGGLRGQPPESTHCNNVGPEHRRQIDPYFARWFGIEARKHANSRQPDAAQLACLTEEAARELGARPFHELVAVLGSQRAVAALDALRSAGPEARDRLLRAAWEKALGRLDAPARPIVRHEAAAELLAEGHQPAATVVRVVLESEPGILVPMLLVRPAAREPEARPVVVAFAQAGKRQLLAERAGDVAHLVAHGVAVCLPDLRGTGETQPEDASRGRTSAATALASSELMLGQTLLGGRVRDLRSVLAYLGSRGDLDTGRVALWGESLAQPNAEGVGLEVPLDAQVVPNLAEPVAAHAAMLAALFEARVAAVAAHGGLVGYASLFESPFCYVPFDALVPGAVEAGDMAAVALALAPRRLRLFGLVDGRNRLVRGQQARQHFDAAIAAYAARRAADRFELLAEPAEDLATAGWLVQALRDP